MGDERYINGSNKPQPKQADRVRAIRLWLHRRLDQLLDAATDPIFSGEVELRISSRSGTLGEPRTGEQRYGITDT